MNNPLNILSFYDAEEFLTGGDAAIAATVEHFGIPESTLLALLAERDVRPQIYVVNERQEAR